MKYICELCGSIYDEATGLPHASIRPGTLFSELPEDFICPGCDYQKEAYNPVKEVSP